MNSKTAIRMPGDHSCFSHIHIYDNHETTVSPNGTISVLFVLQEDSQSDREEMQGQDEQLHRRAGIISAYMQC